MVSTAVCSNAVVLLLLIDCLFLLLLFVGVVFFLLMSAVLSVRSSFSIILLRNRELIALL